MKFSVKKSDFWDYKSIIILFLILIISVNHFWILQWVENRPDQREIPDLQFGMILNDSEDPYWQQFRAGAERAAHFFNVSLYTQYLNDLSINEKENPAQVFERVAFSKMDGLVSYISSEHSYSKVIDAAVLDGIPVVTLENDVINSMRSAFVGYNAYDYGVEAGKKMVEALQGSGKVVIVMNQSENDSKSIQNLKLSGFLSVTNEHKDIVIEDTILSGSGIYGTQELVEKLVNSKADVKGIYITNLNDTKSVAELLVENNKVNQYIIIGSGQSEDIEDYVNKKILYASIFVDGYDMGFRSIETLAKIKNGEAMPSYINSSIGILTPEEKRR